MYMTELCKLKITGTVWSITFLLSTSAWGRGSACVVMLGMESESVLPTGSQFFSLSLSLRMGCYVERLTPFLSDMISFCTASCSPKWIMTVPCLGQGRTTLWVCHHFSSYCKVACGGPRIPVREWPPWWVGLIQPAESIAFPDPLAVI